MLSMPETRYAKSGDSYIAYQVMGDGPFDLVFVPGFMIHLEMQLEFTQYANFMKRLASFCRLIRFDKRGTGLSDRLKAIPTLEERMDDVRAVMDAADSTRAALLGFSEGGPMCVVFAATYPQRTSALILYGSHRHVLATIGVPTLVLHRIGDAISVEHGRYLARQIKWAKYVELPGIDHTPWVGDAASILGD